MTLLLDIGEHRQSRQHGPVEIMLAVLTDYLGWTLANLVLSLMVHVGHLKHHICLLLLSHGHHGHVTFLRAIVQRLELQIRAEYILRVGQLQLFHMRICQAVR